MSAIAVLGLSVDVTRYAPYRPAATYYDSTVDIGRSGIAAGVVGIIAALLGIAMEPYWLIEDSLPKDFKTRWYILACYFADFLATILFLIQGPVGQRWLIKTIESVADQLPRL